MLYLQIFEVKIRSLSEIQKEPYLNVSTATNESNITIATEQEQDIKFLNLTTNETILTMPEGYFYGENFELMGTVQIWFRLINNKLVNLVC